VEDSCRDDMAVNIQYLQAQPQTPEEKQNYCGFSPLLCINRMLKTKNKLKPKTRNKNNQ